MSIRRFILLNKRLYKQATYVILLLMIPIAVMLFKVAAGSDSHVMRIGIYAEDKDAVAARSLMDELKAVREEISFTEYASRDEAIKDVTSAELDEAWIIPADIDETFERLAAGRQPKSTITVYEREQGVTHLFMQELLESKAFKIYAPKVFELGAAKNSGEEGGLDESIKTFYYKAPTNSIFSYSRLGDVRAEEESYLLMPVRGLLAILLLITSFAASIFYMEDTDNGLFIYWHSKFKNLRAVGYYSVVMINSAVLVLLSLMLSGMNTGIVTEAVNLAVYSLALILFSMIVRMIFGSIKTMGVVMPLVVIMSIVLSPVFIDIKGFRAVQAFVPSFYYLMGTYDSYWVVRMCVYCLCEVVMLEVIYRIKRIKL